MANVAVIGAQWGDEGKGKIVDWLSARADVVVRFQGGHNAGHTLVIDGVTYKLSLLPSGVVRPGKLSVIGNGVVVDPWALIEEIEQIRAKGVAVTPETLVVAENAALILPVHRELDRFPRDVEFGHAARHHRARHRPRLRGQGRAPCHPRHRPQGRVDAESEGRTPAGAPQCAAARRRASRKSTRTSSTRALAEIAPKVLPYAAPVWRRLEAARKAGRRVLFEGAQGALLDIDHGTYPYVTSSNTVAGQAAAGSGCGPRDVGFVLGIAKAYTTRVGEGPFPTELNDEIGERIGRTRRRIRHRHRTQAPLRLVRRGAGAPDRDDRRASTASRSPSSTCWTGSKRSRSAPATRSAGASSTTCRPTPTSRRGSSRCTKRCPAGANRREARAPGRSCRRRAIKYIRRVEELIGAPVALLSTSPEREDTILVRDPFVDR